MFRLNLGIQKSRESHLYCTGKGRYKVQPIFERGTLFFRKLVVPYTEKLVVPYNHPFLKNSQDPVPYKHSLPVPYRHSLPVPCNAPPVLLKILIKMILYHLTLCMVLSKNSLEKWLD